MTTLGLESNDLCHKIVILVKQHRTFAWYSYILQAAVCQERRGGTSLQRMSRTPDTISSVAKPRSIIMNDSSNSSTSNIRVIACGYRQVLIRKSNRRFPAWLVQLPNNRQVWRSKRDFWRLQRDVSWSFPKSAWTKLSEQVPWMRPDGCCSLMTVETNNWNVRMQKNLLLLDTFLQQVDKYCMASNDKDGDDALVQVWRDFCRPCDTEDLVDGADDRHEPSAATSGHVLGQYFCSPSNAKLVVDVLWKHIKVLLLDTSNILVVEPSCGHGDLIQALALHSNIHPRILGFDIDPIAVEHCQRQQFNVYTQDFLESKRGDHCRLDDVVVVVGGPPYTNASDDGQQRGLPAAFVQHAIEEWKARVIVFIMPARCRDVNYDMEGYDWETIELEDSTFFFQGSVPVKQPSIIQCFWLIR